MSPEPHKLAPAAREKRRLRSRGRPSSKAAYSPKTPASTRRFSVASQPWLGADGGQRCELGADLGAVTGGREHADLLGERVRVGAQAVGLAVGEVPHVGELAIGQRDQVLELTQHAQRATGRTGLASAD